VKSTSLSWSETADADAFQAKLANFVVQVSRQVDEIDGEPFTLISLYNSNGKLLEAMYPRMLDATLFKELTGRYAGDALANMFEFARRNALNVDEALVEATKELDRFTF
jgi:hypothetical protein